MMWPNKKPPNTVFLDRETSLAVPPTIFADHRYCPFRDDVFECILYDPPFQYDSCPPPWWNNPANKGKWYGFYSSRPETIRMVANALKEFERLTTRLCLKWNDNDIPLWNILSLFRSWKEVSRREYPSRAGGKHKTYWITFLRSSLSKANDPYKGQSKQKG